MSGEDYHVGVEDRGPVRILTLDRPAKLNAFTADGYRRLTERLAAAAAEPAVVVTVITGAGRAFCAGVDLGVAGRPGAGAELSAAFDPLIDTLVAFPKPLLAAVNGPAVGFGATLLLHCDVVVVDETAMIRLPFVPLGTSAEAGSSWLLAGRVGPAQAAWMILSGEAFDASTAVAAGFALRQAPAGRARAETLVLADRLGALPPAALAANKALLQHGRAEQVAAASRRERAAAGALAAELGSLGWDR